MQSSKTHHQGNLGSASSTIGLGVESIPVELQGFLAASGTSAASVLLQPLVEAVWRDADDAVCRLRRTIVVWLACSPYPAIGPCHAPLASACHFLRLEPSVSAMQITATAPTHALRIILLSPESHGVFAIGSLDGQPIVMLDEQALRRAATHARGVISAPQQSQLLFVPPWDVTLSSAAAAQGALAAGAANNPEGLLLPGVINPSGSRGLPPGPPFLPAANSTGLSSSTGPVLRALDVGLEGHSERGPESQMVGGPGAPLLLAQPIISAVAAAWQGSSALARLKRRAALALAAAQDGPEGPYSMLASALGDVLHRHEPEAVAELRHPVTKTLRVKQLLHEGGPNEGSAAQPAAFRSSGGGAGPAGATSSGALGTATAAAAADASSGGNGGGPSFLRVVKGKYDIVVVLDLTELMQVHGSGPGPGPGPGTLGGGAGGGPSGTMTAGLVAGLPQPPMLQLTHSMSSASTASLSSGSLHLYGSAPVPTLTRVTSGLSAVSEGAVQLLGPQGSFPGSATSSTPQLPGSFLIPPGASAAVGVAAPAASTLPYGVEGVSELALRAFPGSTPAAQLRRAIVVHLAGQPRRSQQWTHLGIFVASSQAHLWLNPAHRWPKLKAFVMHPDSRGVFLDIQLPGPGAAAGLVAQDPTALRRAAAAGLATAIMAVWPGNGPLERIRQAAAFTLASAVRGPAGPYTMLGSALGTAIRKRDKEAFDALAGMGKLSELLNDMASASASASAAAGGGGTGGGVMAAAPGSGSAVGLAATTVSGAAGGSAAESAAAEKAAAVDAAGAVASVAAAAATRLADSGAEAAAGLAGAEGLEGLASVGSVGAAGRVSTSEAPAPGGETEASMLPTVTSGPVAAPAATPFASGADGGSGAGGDGNGSGYIVSFKKDQDGYMRLRLEALLQDFPREELPSAAAVAVSGAAIPGTTTALVSLPSAEGSSLPTSLASFTDLSLTVSLPNPAGGHGGAGSTGAALSLPLYANPAAGLTGPPGSAAATSAATAIITSVPGGPSSMSALMPVMGAGSPPLEQELLRRFPPPPGAAPSSDQATIAAAKRCIARLLAWAPPPHQLTFAKLGAQVPKLLGGARIGRNLRLVCLEEPEVFAVQSQSPTVHVVRLVCTRLLQLAHEQSERKAHGSPPSESSPSSSALVGTVLAAAPGGLMSSAAAQGPGLAHHPTSQLVFVQQPGGSLLPPPPPSSQQQHQHQQQQQPFAKVVQLQSQQSQVAQPLQAVVGGVTSPHLQLAQQQGAQSPQLVGISSLRGSAAAPGLAPGQLRLQQQQLPLMQSAGSQVTLAPLAQGGSGAGGGSDLLMPHQQPMQLVTIVGPHDQAARTAAAATQGTWPPAGRQLQQRLQPQSQHVTLGDAVRVGQRQLAVGAVAAGSGGATGLYGDRLPLTSSAPLQLTARLTRGEPYGTRTLDAGSVSQSWQASVGGVGASGLSAALQQPRQAQAQLAAAVGTGQVMGGVVQQQLQDFAASALVAEQVLQSQAAAADPGAPGVPPRATGLVTSTAIHLLSDPYCVDFLSVLQHCHSCAQVGLAVQVYDGRPALVCLYAPAAVAGSSVGPAGLTETWPAAVYLLDCTASSAGEGPDVFVATLLTSLRGLLEEPGVAKVVHGCEQVRALEVAAGASIAPLLDTRVLLEAMFTMLPSLPVPPSTAALAAAAASAAPPLPAGGYNSAEAAAMAQLTAHIGGLRAVLQSVELWNDRPEMVGVLAGLHMAAHRAELWAAAGRDRTWLSRPLTESQMKMAAQAAHQLPELWAALCEAVPWLAAHAALRLMQQLRGQGAHGSQGQG